MTKRTSQAFVAKVVKLKGAAERGPNSRETNNGIFLRLSEGWALGHDRFQWMLVQWQGEARGWRSVSFVASNKGVLMRVLGENGITPTPEAKAALDRLPDTFKEWLSEQDRRKAA